MFPAKSFPAKSLALIVRASKSAGPPVSSDVQALLQACQAVQSPASRRIVEEFILRLYEKTAQKQNENLRQKVKPGAYRTIWSSVTSDTIPGLLLRQAPNSVLGGDSWQLISKDGRKAENIVYWSLGKWLSVRMVGLANLQPLVGSNGYELVIKGLEFRWGPRGYLPEVYSEPSQGASGGAKINSARVLYLEDGKELSNGRGTLDVLYFDGLLRISRDSIQKNTYVHILEPLSKSPFSQLYPQVV